MLFRITGDSDTEVGGFRIPDALLQIVAVVQIANLPDQVGGMAPATLLGDEALLPSRRVSPEREHIVDADEVELDQGVLDLLRTLAATDHMADHRDMVCVLQEGAERHRARSLVDHMLLHQPVLALHIVDHALMVGDVDIGGMERKQCLDCVADVLDAPST